MSGCDVKPTCARCWVYTELPIFSVVFYGHGSGSRDESKTKREGEIQNIEKRYEGQRRD